MTHRGRRGADHRLAVALAGGASVREAARTAGVSERTAHRRMGDPTFRRAVAEARDAMTRQTVGRLVAAGTRATGTLLLMLSAEAEPVRVQAARVLLDAGLKYREHVELAQRLAELEARSEGNGGENQ